MKRSKSLLMLIPLLIGGIQTAKSEVIVPALTEFQRAIEDDLVEDRKSTRLNSSH